MFSSNSIVSALGELLVNSTHSNILLKLIYNGRHNSLGSRTTEIYISQQCYFRFNCDARKETRNEKSIFQFFTAGILILAGSYFHSLLSRRRLGGKRRRLKQDVPLRGVYSLRDDPSFDQHFSVAFFTVRTRGRY